MPPKRRVILYIAASLDGFIAGPDGNVDWLTPFPGEDHGYAEFIASIDTLIMGRKTYDQMLSFGDWPHGTMRSIVLTSSPLPDERPARVEAWSDGADALDAVRDGGDGKDIWLVGGARTAQEFVARGLVDRLEIYVVPVVLGDGVRLFAGGNRGIKLCLLESRPYSSGVVMLAYGLAPSREPPSGVV